MKAYGKSQEAERRKPDPEPRLTSQVPPRRVGETRESGVHRAFRDDFQAQITVLRAAALQADQASERWELLAIELHQNAAPGDFVRAAASLARSEARSAREFREACEAQGAACAPLRRKRRVLLDLFSAAFDQATEGVVRGAFRREVLTQVANSAVPSELRDIAGRAAPVAARGTLFAGEVVEWALSHLSPRRGRLIYQGQTQALEELRSELLASSELHALSALGLVDLSAALEMLEGLEAQILGEAPSD